MHHLFKGFGHSAGPRTWDAGGELIQHHLQPSSAVHPSFCSFEKASCHPTPSGEYKISKYFDRLFKLANADTSHLPEDESGQSAYIITHWALIGSNSLRRFQFCANQQLRMSDKKHNSSHSETLCERNCPALIHPSTYQPSRPWLPYICPSSFDPILRHHLTSCYETLTGSLSAQSRLTRRFAKVIGVGLWECITRSEEWKRAAENLGFVVDVEPEQPPEMSWESPFLSLEGNERPFHKTSALALWVKQCLWWAIEVSSFNRMLQFQLLDHISIRLGVPLPYYAVDDRMLGVAYIDNICQSSPYRATLIRHGVPYFDLVVRRPFVSLSNPDVSPTDNKHGQALYDAALHASTTCAFSAKPVYVEKRLSHILRPKTWLFVPPASSEAYSRCFSSFWAVINYIGQDADPSVIRELYQHVYALAAPYGDELDGFYPLHGHRALKWSPDVSTPYMKHLQKALAVEQQFNESNAKVFSNILLILNAPVLSDFEYANMQTLPSCVSVGSVCSSPTHIVKEGPSCPLHDARVTCECSDISLLHQARILPPSSLDAQSCEQPAISNGGSHKHQSS
jgi:hypothetical protein